MVQDGINSDLIGALRQLSESLQKICSESENFNKLLVSAGVPIQNDHLAFLCSQDILRGSNAVLCSLQEQGQNRLPRLESHITSCYRAEKEGILCNGGATGQVNVVFVEKSNCVAN